MNKNTKTWKERICITCGCVFLATDYQVEKRNKKFCSMGCKRYSSESKKKISESLKGSKAWNKGLNYELPEKKTGRNFNCITCGKEFYRAMWQIKRGEQKYCSNGCLRYSDESKQKMSKSHIGMNKGENNHNWKGGVSSENDKIRKSFKYNNWRKTVYKRDNWTCQKCGNHCPAKDIVAHHILFFNEYKELRFEVDNGLTLCRSCHKKMHNKLKEQSNKLKIILSNQGSLNFK